MSPLQTSDRFSPQQQLRREARASQYRLDAPFVCLAATEWKQTLDPRLALRTDQAVVHRSAAAQEWRSPAGGSRAGEAWRSAPLMRSREKHAERVGRRP